MAMLFLKTSMHELSMNVYINKSRVIISGVLGKGNNLMRIGEVA